jgi:hypothetical protein
LLDRSDSTLSERVEAAVRKAAWAAANAVLPVLAFVSSGAAVAQSAGTNPDLSVIGQFLYCPLGAEDCSWPEAESELELQEIEFAFQGHLNPYARADVFVGFHEGEFEIEEASASFLRGLGPVQARLGQYRVGWGNVNPLHPHAYSWIFQPLIEERLFGEEGLNQIAAGLNVSFPIGEDSELVLAGDLLRGDLADGHGVEEGDVGAGAICVGPGCDDGTCSPGDTDCALVFFDPGEVEALEEGPELAWHARFSWFDQLGDARSLQLGLDALHGSLEPALDRKLTWYGANGKYRWRSSSSRSLNVIASYMRSAVHLEAEIATGTVCLGPDCASGVCPAGGVCTEITVTEHARGERLETSGWYAIADWQFARRWNGGLKSDSAQGLEQDDLVRRTEAFLNFRLMEESTLFRLLLRREDGDLLDEATATAVVQLVFSLGPHRPHEF